MTTYTLTGFAVYRSLATDIVNGVDNTDITLELVVPEATTSLSYTVNSLGSGGVPGEGDETVDIAINDYTLRVGGQTVGGGTPIDPEISIFEVVWKDGANITRTSTVLVANFDTDVPGLGLANADYIFVISGDMAPPITSIAAWNVFEGSITSIAVPTGPYGPGTTIPLTSLGATVGEDDIITGTPGNDVFRGGDGDDHIHGMGGNDRLFGGDGSDKLFGGDGNDFLNPGDNTSFDQIHAGAGQDKVVLSNIANGYVQLEHQDLDARIIVNMDGNANTGTIRKIGNGITTIIDVKNPMQADGLGLGGTAFNDVFNVTVANGGWMQVRGDGGKDIYRIGDSTGSVRIDLQGGTQGVIANLTTGKIKNDGFGNIETITGTGKVWEIRASMQNDKITGSGNDESFILMAGTDVLNGKGGYDRLRYDRTEVDGVTVNLEAGTGTGTWGGVAFNHTISGIEHVRGSNGNDTLTGANAQDDRLEGRDGDDVIKGGGGNDRLEGGNGNDRLFGGDGNDRLEGGDGNDILRGQAGDDRLEGGAGNDKLYGGDGQDALRGGDGNDLLNPGDSTSYDAINAGRGKDKIVLSEVATGSVSLDHWDLGAGITANIDGNANTGKIIKSGGGGITTIINIKNPMLADGLTIGGTAFNDTFNVTVADGGWMQVGGRAGKDTYNIGASTGTVRLDLRDYDPGATGVTVNLTTGKIKDDGYGNIEFITGQENIREVRTSMQDDKVTGSDRDERFILMAGNDTVNGKGGFDQLRYDRTEVDGVNIDLGTGIGTGTWRGAAFTHTISNIEQVRGSGGDDILKGSDTLGDRLDGGDGNDILRGKGGDDRLYGDNGNDKIYGGDGTDRLRGGDGDDLLNPGDNTGFDVVNAGRGTDKIVLTGISTGYAQLDHWDLSARITVNVDGNANSATINKSGGGGTTTVIGIKNPMLASGLGVYGTSFNDTFNVTVADGGWMQINGLGGKDSYTIGASTGQVRLDFRDFDGLATGVTVNLSTGKVKDDGFGNVEFITGKVWEVRGTMQDDKITGSGNDESFILMAGNDTVIGKGGFDRLRYDQTGVDGVTVDLDTGIATGTWGGVAFSHTISGIEHVRGSDGNDKLTGANAQDDTLDGRDGDDVIKGGDGNDTLIGGNGKDKLLGGKGNDRLEGGGANDQLDGGRGNDRLFGGKGNDRLDGGQGNDVMTGGTGADRFIFGAGDDVVTDFNAANNKEKVDLSGVSAIISFNDLKNNHVTQNGSDLLIDDKAGNTLTLNGLTIGDLDSGDFIF